MLTRLQQESAGRLRPLNVLADKTLLAAYVDDARVPTLSHLQQALQEINLSDPDGVSATARSTFRGDRLPPLSAGKPLPSRTNAF